MSSLARTGDTTAARKIKKAWMATIRSIWFRRESDRNRFPRKKTRIINFSNMNITDRLSQVRSLPRKIRTMAPGSDAPASSFRSSRPVLDTAMDLLTFVVVAAHVFVCPYTKVEESFNAQAIHDIVKYGISVCQKNLKDANPNRLNPSFCFLSFFLFSIDRVRD